MFRIGLGDQAGDFAADIGAMRELGDSLSPGFRFVRRDAGLCYVVEHELVLRMPVGRIVSLPRAGARRGGCRRWGGRLVGVPPPPSFWPDLCFV